MGIDIVALQLFVAAGGQLASLPELNTIRQQGHAIEVRFCAENPFNNFLPCTGTVTMFEPVSRVLGVQIPHVRYEVGIASGSRVSVHFDSMISKIIVWAIDRVSAIQKMNYVLSNTVCLGVTTNQLLLHRILAHPGFQHPDYTTSFIGQHEADLFKPVSIDYPSGPMMMAAVLYNRQLRDSLGEPRVFGSIPAGFRNQPKDGKTSSREFVSCQLELLGHNAASHFMVTRTAADEYEVAQLMPELPLTSAQKHLLFNQNGGSLTRRFYHATSSRATSNFKVRLLQQMTSLVSPNDQYNREVRLCLGNEQHTFFISVLNSDEFKHEISVYSQHVGYSANYILAHPLSWAGKLKQKEKQGFGSSGMHISVQRATIWR